MNMVIMATNLNSSLRYLLPKARVNASYAYPVITSNIPGTVHVLLCIVSPSSRKFCDANIPPILHRDFFSCFMMQIIMVYYNGYAKRVTWA